MKKNSGDDCPVGKATAQYYFTKESLMQHLMHQLKYKRNKELGLQLGRMMGDSIGSQRFNVDALIPLPLFPPKKKEEDITRHSFM